MSDNKGTLEVMINHTDERMVCATCGEEIEDGEEFTWEPEPLYGKRAVVSCHPHCSVRNGWRLRYET